MGREVHRVDARTGMTARRVALTITAMAAVAATGAPTANASVVIRHFANCTAMHVRYPHGVGRLYAHDHTSGTPVTTFFRNNRLYAANSGSDRDHDGIACEKR